ncbi:MAG: hypothetical protein MJE77_32965 [Proteobacteria bacterium]|nr:hypothetical protein [Pseudomonadota bacterium]
MSLASLVTTDEQSTRPYRRYAFTHWLNLGFLLAGGAAAVVFGPAALLVVLPVEAGAMWVVPDLQMFRAGVDEQLASRELQKERSYYMQQLWGLTPPRPKSFGQKLLGLFTEIEEESLDDRIIQRDSKSYAEYTEMRQIIAKLRELRQLRDVSIREHEFDRLEQVVNGYLRFVIACRALANALHNVDQNQLQNELDEVNAKLTHTTNPELRAVLAERKRLCEARRQRLPKIEATLELFRTRAETIVYQMRNIYSQVLADPGMDVNAYLDDMVERHEILVDPLGSLEAEHLLENILNPDAAVRQRTRAVSQRNQ